MIGPLEECLWMLDTRPLSCLPMEGGLKSEHDPAQIPHTAFHFPVMTCQHVINI